MVETNEPGRHECDPNTWLSGLAMVTAQLGLKEKGRIRAVVVSANGSTLVPVDASGDPLDFAMTSMDRRAKVEADLIFEFSDTPLDASFYLPKAFWIMRHKPEIYERTRHFLPCAEYISFFLTGNAVRIVPTQMFRDFFWNKGAIPHCAWSRRSFRRSWTWEIRRDRPNQGGRDAGTPGGRPVIARRAQFHHVHPRHRRNADRAHLRQGGHFGGHQPLLRPAPCTTAASCASPTS